MKQNEYIKAVIYARFSAEDNEKNGAERSIQNQIEVAKEYIFDKGYDLVYVYTDIGKTGTNMNRPGLKKMFNDMKSGLFNTIIVKDFSRFSRNYLEAGDYLENIFPENNVRFISINDGYDSFIGDDDIVPLHNFLNSMYIKDIKRKIHKSVKERYKKKEFVFVPKYGYKKDKDGKLVIDEASAEVIRNIYKYAIDGIKAKEIAQILESAKVLVPSAYKELVLKIKPNKKVSNIYKWDISVINDILKDQRYCGDGINFKKKKSLVINEKNIVISNAHPAIISKEEFLQVPRKARTDNVNCNGYFKNVYCECCERKMVYRRNVRKTGCPP